MSTSIDWPMEPLPYRVLGSVPETSDTYTLALGPADGEHIAPFVPGQFTMLYAFGIGEVPISISGNPAEHVKLGQTVRAVGAVTQALCRLTPGDAVGVRGPFGSTWPVAEAEGQDVVIVAGGPGLAPLRPAIYHLLAHRGNYGRISIVYGARTPADLLYQEELQRWRSRFDLEVLVTVDAASPAWRGDIGVVTRLIPRVPLDPVHTMALVCGPEIMMRFALQALQQVGLGPEHIYISMERNMQCALGYCGHCQFGPAFICRDGPVLRYDRVERLVGIREV